MRACAFLALASAAGAGAEPAEGLPERLQEVAANCRRLQSAFPVRESGSERYAEAVRFHADKFARSFVHQDRFRVAVLGTHCGSEREVDEVRSSLDPVFRAAGSQLHVVSTHQTPGCAGSSSVDAWCLRQLSGDDTDVVVYAWADGGSSVETRESMLRWALLMDHSPGLLVLGSDHLCAPDADPLQQYAPLGYSVFCGGRAAVLSAVHFLATAALEAARMIETERDPAGRWKRQPSVLRLSLLPKPVRCSGRLCGTEEPPGCRTQSTPVRGRPQIGIDDIDAPLNPYRGGPKNGAKGWVGRLLPPISNCSRDTRCGGFEGVTEDDGWISFSLPRMVAGIIAVCCCCDEDCASNQLSRDAVEYALDAEPVDPFGSGDAGWLSPQCVVVQDGWPPTPSNSYGHIHLGVRVKGKKRVLISRVLTL